MNLIKSQKVSRLVIIPNYEDDFVELRSGIDFRGKDPAPLPGAVTPFVEYFED